MRWGTFLGAGLVLAASSGCVHVPTKTVSQDRFDYGAAIADSWKRQTLVNIARIRYGDAPTFMDVTSVINSYSISGSVNGGANIAERPGFNGMSLGAAGNWSNTPTVTYQPLSGQKFTESLLRPIPPSAVFQMIEAGWPIPVIFRTALRFINGLSNQALGKRGDPGFDRLVEALTRLQQSRALSIRVEQGKGGDAVLVALRSKAPSGSDREDFRIVRESLELRENAPEYSVTFGLVPTNDQEIAVLTRSMLEIMVELSSGVEVPSSDLVEGRALHDKVPPGESPAEPLIRIRSSASAPADAFVAVPYRGLWFWIDDTDFPSKARFTFLMILSSLAESGQPSVAPLVTVSAGK